MAELNDNHAEGLLEWYHANEADYFFRQKPTAYTTWVSEIMLQQTRMDTVLPKLKAFLERFNDVTALAAASEADVLEAWQGLGYYNRARNLHRAAQQIQERGGFPESAAEWEKLSGIGPYTAAAISSICNGQNVQVFDGNIRRIVCRLTRQADCDAPAAARCLQGLYNSGHRAGELNQALMDLGRLVCTRSRPACPACPLQTGCGASPEEAGQYPLSQKKATLDLQLTFLICYDSTGRLLIKDHDHEPLLKKLSFPPWSAAGALQFDSPLAAALNGLEPLPGSETGTKPAFRHSIMHYRIAVYVKEYHLRPDHETELTAALKGARFTEADYLTRKMVSSLGRKLHRYLQKRELHLPFKP